MQGLIGGSLTIFAALHLCVKIAFLHIRFHNLKGRFIARKITKFAKTQRHLFAYNLCSFASLREKYLLFYFRCPTGSCIARKGSELTKDAEA